MEHTVGCGIVHAVTLRSRSALVPERATSRRRCVVGLAETAYVIAAPTRCPMA